MSESASEYGRIELRRHITRDMLRAEPHVLFVFGDNLKRQGLGGQAKEMRGEPNAVGIPTKHAPHTRAGAFFDDRDLPFLADVFLDHFRQLAEQIRAGRPVVWPAAGIGTGLANLEQRAPVVWAYLERCREKLFCLAAEVVPAPSETDQQIGGRYAD